MRGNSLYEKLKKYEASDFYGFHMPGHKRNTELMGQGLPYGIDITEIDGFDDLHHADGILLELEQRIAKLYGAGSIPYPDQRKYGGNHERHSGVCGQRRKTSGGKKLPQIGISRHGARRIGNGVSLSGI